MVYSIAFRGNRVCCPCCGSTFSQFLPYGHLFREDAVCLKCGSLERHRLIALYLERNPHLFRSGARLLHVAPSRALGPRLAAIPGVEYLSVDLDSPQAMVRMDLTQLNLPDCSFDAIVCIHVLEHILNDRTAMREMYRVLRPGGWGIIQSPVDTSLARTLDDERIASRQDRLTAYGNPEHVRRYGRDYSDRLRAEGFLVKEDDIGGRLPVGEVDRYGLQLGEVVTFCVRE